MSAPAGWYPQPDGQQRYWDGELWTEYFAPGVPAVGTPATVGEAGRPGGEFEDVIPTSDRLTPGHELAQVPVETRGSNGLAVAGFVLALLGVLTSFIPLVSIGGDVLAFVGLILGIIGLVQSGKKRAGSGFAIAAIILSVAAFAISIVVNTATISVVNQAVKALPSARATAEPTGEPSAQPTAAKVGSPITVTGLDGGSEVTVVVKKIVDPTDSTNEFSAPAPGSRYVAVQFEITNTGTVLYDDFPALGATVKDAQGRQFDFAFTEGVTAGARMPDSVKLLPGKKTLGYIVFEVPDASKVASVKFGMEAGLGDTGEWQVK
jgi:hypothetical protein